MTIRDNFGKIKHVATTNSKKRKKGQKARLLRASQTPYEQELLQREIDATDAQIDRLVYDLYGLTEEEIKIVEGETED
jgi:hypothetical protein